MPKYIFFTPPSKHKFFFEELARESAAPIPYSPEKNDLYAKLLNLWNKGTLSNEEFENYVKILKESKDLTPNNANISKNQF